MTFIQELKQRRIVQIVASYAVSGWVAMEVVGALVERGVLPELVYRMGLVVYLGGLVVSSVTGWFHGEKGHQKATAMEIWLLFLITVGTGYFGFRTVQSYRASAFTEQAVAEGRLALSRVAVLYFRDMSRNGNLAHVADGLTESIIERLEGVSGLDLISQAGSAQFRESTLPVDSIAEALGAGILVDGTVEDRGQDVRVNLVLIDGASGTELQRETVERPADQLFELQDELSEEVAGLLRVALGEQITLRTQRQETASLPAWTAYRRGLRLRRTAEDAIRRNDVSGFIADYQTADSLLTLAEELDDQWPAPTVVRAAMASRWGELSAFDDPVEGREYMQLGLQRADAALAKDPREARAYRVRGTIHFLRWAYGLTEDAGERQAAFEDARSDLEQAVDLDPGLAAAWSTLSVLYSEIPDLVEANLAARRALEADEFLSSAASVMSRLYATSYDLEQFREAIQYCDQGARRFPDTPEFVECRLWLMAAPRGLEPDVDQAWEDMEEHLAMVPEADQERARIQDRLVVASILARADLPDSAKAVIATAQATPDIDPTRELLGVEALAHLRMGDPVTALDRLKIYLTASPEHRAGWRWSSHWWWRDLQDNAEFRRLIGS